MFGSGQGVTVGPEAVRMTRAIERPNSDVAEGGAS